MNARYVARGLRKAELCPSISAYTRAKRYADQRFVLQDLLARQAHSPSLTLYLACPTISAAIFMRALRRQVFPKGQSQCALLAAACCSCVVISTGACHGARARIQTPRAVRERSNNTHSENILAVLAVKLSFLVWRTKYIIFQTRSFDTPPWYREITMPCVAVSASSGWSDI